MFIFFLVFKTIFNQILLFQGQLANEKRSEPSIYNLNGRIYESKNLTYNRERWHEFPFHYKPFEPYRIIKDLTIMPGATLTIEKGVEVS